MIRKVEGLPDGFTWVEAELGKGDVLITSCHKKDVKHDHGILISENPNGERPLGETYKELCGEQGTCVAETGMVIFFKTPEDIDRLIRDLTALKDGMVAVGA